MEKIAVTFINSYIAFIESNPDESVPYTWVQKNILLSNEFKARYKNTIEAGYIEDPELGIGFDPILNAQDIPGSEGYVAINCNTENNSIDLQGKDNKTFTNTVKLNNAGGIWLITSIGAIK